MLYSPEEIKQQTRELWRTCFNHSEEFMDIYFDEKYTDEANLTIRHDGRVVAATQLLPYRFTFYGSVQHIGYLSALATSPENRNRGFASNLIHEAHRRLFKQGATLSFLIHPSENDFFAALEDADLKDGYVLVAHRKRRMVGFCLAVKEPNG